MNQGNRRDFFRRLGAQALAILALGAPWRSLAAEGKPVAIPLAKLPKLKRVGGSVTIKLRGNEWLLARSSQDQIHALSAICTHAQCRVHYEHETKRIACKCHRSHFDLDGKAIDGPAKKPLNKAPARIEDGRVILELE